MGKCQLSLLSYNPPKRAGACLEMIEYTIPQIGLLFRFSLHSSFKISISHIHCHSNWPFFESSRVTLFYFLQPKIIWSLQTWKYNNLEQIIFKLHTFTKYFNLKGQLLLINHKQAIKLFYLLQVYTCIHTCSV